MKMTLLKPERLNFGDTIGIIAPASPPQDPKAVDRAAQALERFGFKPKLAKNVRARHGFLAGGDRERAADLMVMFADKKVKAIICMRGGYGTARILDRLDYGVIRQNPKIFSGYSDITSLHCVLAQKVNLISVHAPMFNGALDGPKVPEFTKKSFFRTVMEAKPAGSICDGYDKKGVLTLRGGVVEGRLIGGNLSLICASLGTPFAPSFKRKILFFEDISEKPYRLDRMLTQLLNAGILQQVAGVAVGVNQDCADPDAKVVKEYLQTAADVLKERLASLRVPVVTGLPFGHVDLNATIPVGAKARLDGKRGDLIITESAVN
ncbi:MAG TPA: LD-carboxypeptidase [Verrucomicrobiae bacterium]|nr:LD-carboxypeptidase [Verrucomicrobiae bacterium]